MLTTRYTDINKAIAYSHRRIETPHDIEFHLHNQFEIYFFISGNVNYLIEKKVYPLKYGDLLLMNNLEIHKPTFLPGEIYERIVIHFEPQLAQLFNSATYNLLASFVNRPKGENNKLSLTKAKTEEILQLFSKIESSSTDLVPEAAVLKLTYFLQLLVLINQNFCNIQNENEKSNIPDNLARILDYIDMNLESNLSLEYLAKKFYINGSYLSVLFKKWTGSNIHEYIIYKRISKAKKMLTEGSSATDACLMSGFNDYSNFSRIFKRTVGVSPRRYRGDNK